jgi:hypothetical protein
MTVPDFDQVFLPQEAAKYLDISMQKLSRLRRQKKIHGTRVGETNLYTYTPADLKRANLQKEKRGPKHPRNQYSKDTKTST